jgi:redox-sensitive bicupin YhaK (pirin superfamily)
MERQRLMNRVREIEKVWKSRPTLEGAGVHLRRAFGFQEVPQLDPFLLLDDFHSRDPKDYLPGFPWHPHRGIETITYVLQGKVEHGDSMEKKGTISSGDVQWMTAGSGIIHQEMPKGSKGGLMWGFQLWANLPRSQKMMSPRYRDVKSKQIPEVTLDSGTKVKIICGTVNDVSGPVKDIVIDPEYLSVSIPPEKTFIHPVKSGHTIFVYVIEGKGYFDQGRDSYAHEVIGSNYFDLKRECLISAENLILYGRVGNQIVVTTEEVAVRFLLISGKPIGEPVAWYGPIVMNTQEELRIAFEEYQNGTFIKHEK